MQKFLEDSKRLLNLTKDNWKERQSLIMNMTAHVTKTQDPQMIIYLQKSYKNISIQFQDLRWPPKNF